VIKEKACNLQLAEETRLGEFVLLILFRNDMNV